MSVKTRKVTLIAVGETASDRTKVYNYVKNIADTLSKVGNQVIRLHVGNQYELDEMVKGRNITKGESIKILTEKLGTSIQNSGYRLTSNFPHISSEIRTAFNQTIYKTIQNNFYDILMGKMSIPSFRKTNINIPFSASKDELGRTKAIYLDGDKYYFNLPLTLAETKIHKEIKFSLFFGRDRSNNRIIVDRLVSGEYTLCDSSIQVKDNEFSVLLTYKQPDEVVEASHDNVMGVDLGINRPVSFYIAGMKHQPQQINIGLKIQHERMKFYKQRRSLQETLKFSSGGHGRNRKLSALNKLSQKESNWSVLINHKISRELINIAKDNNVGTIKMEDLTGITTNSKDYFLKSWAYYQLQTDIEYKAKELGITILWVNPKDTSNTCPTCGTSNVLNRNDKDKTKFRCINGDCKDFDKEKDADIVGSYNISHKDGELVKGKSKKGKMEKGKKKQLSLVE
jgi:IS605 OrfB family transposase